MIIQNEMQELESTTSTPIRSRPLPAEFPGAHALDNEEEQALLRVCRSRSLYRYNGIDPQHEAASFEREFAEFVGIRHAVAVTSGTAALHTALGALGIGPGQEVIIPAYLWVSIAGAVVNLGAIPVLGDIDETFCLNADDVRSKITPRTSVILIAHMNGAPGNIVEIASLARERGIFLLEDCAQCVGGTVGGRSVGTFGDIAIFSFQMNKNISAGEGGAVITDSRELWQRAVAIHDVGYARDAEEKLILEEPSFFGWGRGYRLDELRAAVLRVQLRKLPSTLSRLRASKLRLRQALRKMDGLTLRRQVDEAGDTGAFLLSIFPTGGIAEAVNHRMRWHNISCSADAVSNVVLKDYGLHIYSNIPALVQKAPTDPSGAPWNLEANRESVYTYGLGTCPVADDLFRRTQLLTVPACLTEQDEQDIITAFADALAVAHSG